MIKEIRVFHVTAAFSIFAYLWLFFIISVSSPDIVEVWEGALTLIMMPILVLVSYLFDIGALGGKGPPVLGKARMPKQSLHESLDRQPSGVLASSEASGNSGGDKNERSNSKSSHARGSIVGEGDHGIQNGQVLDKDGEPIKNKNGVFTFESDMLEICVASEERHLVVPVLRCNGSKGTVTCNYRTERLTAMPGYDYVETEGTLTFAQGETRQEVSITLLPKKPMEHSDEFQVILDEATGGAVFNLNDDGGEDANILTVTVLNGHERALDYGWGDRFLTAADGTLNFDEMRAGTLAWLAEIRDAVLQVTDDEEEQPGIFDYVMHVISVFWKVLFAAFVPPPTYRSGWPCFASAIVFIGLLTVVVLDFAELIGCVCQLDESVVAITLVALGTSMPDLFASKTAACEDPYADASIINVTGSNSVNVFLGVGLPWTLAAIHWTVVGATDEWQYMYPAFVSGYPNGAFVVQGGESLGFSVFVFVLAAFVALSVIAGRRYKFGGELGGPLLFKLMSSLLMTSLWVFFLALTIWSAQTAGLSTADRIGMVALAFCVLLAVVALLGAVLVGVLRAWPQEQPEPESEPDSAYASVLPQQTVVVEVAKCLDVTDAMKEDSELKPKDAVAQPQSDQDLVLPNVPTPPGGSN
jgi:Ca2+/Na+ antiporter